MAVDERPLSLIGHPGPDSMSDDRRGADGDRAEEGERVGDRAVDVGDRKFFYATYPHKR